MLKVGDEVESIVPVGGKGVIGAKGVIVSGVGNLWTVRFNDNIDGWGNDINDMRYWYVNTKEIQLVESELPFDISGLFEEATNEQ